eukprot:CAMPEP_0114239402 /NCGR_PEP_ID=MMETSP0058-20121206/8441_1 /TAXON_ID=36894 /ORGANISM="Pyramimonas parkeae, CCMP726" /LENGTH=764 /DNA_ID=CAMNT_0001351581 /DNA_START=97 /DNA_END=2391 /DNA_ORIENTATION=+
MDASAYSPVTPIPACVGASSSGVSSFTNSRRSGATAASRGVGAPPKKLVIKPFKEKPKLPEDFEEITWAKLKNAVAAVQAKQPVSCSLEELYRAVEDLCVHKKADNLYTKLQEVCDQHIALRLKSLHGRAADPVIFLSLMDASWQDHCSQMLMIRSIFLYLDRTFVIQTSGVRSLWDLGLQLFRTHLEQGAEIVKKCVKGLLMLLEKERLGEAVDRTLCKNLLRMLTSLQMYPEVFEKPFLEQSTSFYAAEGVRLLQHTDVPDYLLHCETRFQEENDRCVHYLDASTRKPLLAVVEKELLERHTSAVLEKGFDSLMSENRIADLARMYVLLRSVNKLDAMRVALSGYVKKTGRSIVMDEEKDSDLVHLLLDLKSQLDAVLVESFDRNESFANTMKDAFEHFINQRANRPAELIAKFIDMKLRVGNKGQSEEEMEALLDQVLTLFRFIQGKDVFEAFYKKDLAKRLLLGKSASIDTERSMIAKLKTECGSQFTNKLEGMFKDIDLSRDFMTGFRQCAHASAKLPQGIEMSIHVLTQGYWPTYPPMEVNLPVEITAYQDIFRDFYLSKHSGRRLMWQNSLAQCVLRARFDKGAKELSVSLFQTVVLMLFNDHDHLSFTDISEATKIEDKELRRTLQSLACAKVRVINKEPRGRDIGDADVFHFNSEFSEKLFRIKVNSIQMKETVEENTATTERVFQDRQYQIDAAIVRIMKTRKTLSHPLLISELYKQCPFPFKPADMKKRIESLIDREYLERDKNNPHMYNYLA